MDFKINTSIMGDSTSGLGRPTINFVHTDLDGETADSIKVWSGIEGSGIYSTVSNVVKSSNTLSFTDNAMILERINIILLRWYRMMVTELFLHLFGIA
ncbi:MAG: hypothetical protein IPJ32_06895 [Sphingobacteriaceae bacterium]|nr:hypothetical protein [Sphingobacteriaceae bacterium]